MAARYSFGFSVFFFNICRKKMDGLSGSHLSLDPFIDADVRS